jgi:type VI secretion system Hcp family effector
MLQFAFLKLEMQVSGWIKGTSKQKGMEEWIEIAEFHYGVKSPKDQLSGIHRGRRLHDPIEFVTEARMPGNALLFQALTKNEKVKTAELRFFRADGDSGKNVCHTTIKTTGGGLSSMQYVLPNVYGAADGQLVTSANTIPAYIKASYTFEDFEIQNNDSKNAAHDNWAEGHA